MIRIAGIWMALAMIVGAILPVHAQTPDDPRNFGGAAWQFGVIGPADAAALDQLGAGWMQIPFEWAALQPDGPDRWRADAVDADLIAAVVDSGREVVGLITGTPGWASASGQRAAVPDGLAQPFDDPGNAWAAFVRRLAATYAPMGVHHWIIYDEPNVRVGEGRVRFAGGVDDYARLLKVAYQAAKTADQEAVIHVAAMNWWVDDAAGRAPYLARLLDTLTTDPDAAAQHYYIDVITVRVTGNMAAVWSELADARAMLDASGVGLRPIWLEASAQPTDSTSAAALDLSRAQTADFVIQAAALAVAGGAERIAFAGLHHAPGGVFAPASVLHDFERLPAFEAYRTAIDLFAATQRAVRYTHPAAELVVLEQAERDVYVMWAVGDQDVLFSITSGVEGEPATIYTPQTAREIESQEVDWPAVFRITVPAARRDANGFLLVGGTPTVIVLARDDAFVRVTYVRANVEWARLR
jgi:hypothetical protein